MTLRLLRLFCLLALFPPGPAAGEQREVAFQKLATRLVETRLSGGDESASLEDEALRILDGIVLERLNVPGEVGLAALNEHLATLVAQQPPVGESYQVLRLGGQRAVYALVANFGLSGPSAVRLYSSGPQGYRLAARIDRFTQRDFFDEYLELVQVEAPAAVFVTVAGRTDELQTGAFTAWRFDDEHLETLWTSEILPRSTYEAGVGGFLLTYCGETDEEHPRVCRRMTRERYAWEDGGWKHKEHTSLPVSAR